MKVFTTVALALSAVVLTSSAVLTTIGSSDGLVQVSADSRTHGSTHGTSLSTRAAHEDFCCDHPKKKHVKGHEDSKGREHSKGLEHGKSNVDDVIDAIVHAHAEVMNKYIAKLKVELCRYSSQGQGYHHRFDSRPCRC